MHLGTIPPLHVDHWTTFQEHMDHPVIWPGKVPQKWAASVRVDDSFLGTLPKEAVTRDFVKDFCQDARNSDEACFLIIMAWGGMHVSNGRLAWPAHARWLTAVKDMRQGAIQSRACAFDAFQRAEVPGMGIAYFTKLMYFLCSGPTCYILDQWTARSTNLLRSPSAPLVRLQQKVVTNRNQVGVYLEFCDFVDHLAAMTGSTGDKIEESMFAGGRGHPWRAVVRRLT